MGPRTGTKLIVCESLPWHAAPSIVPVRPPGGERVEIIRAMADLLAIERPGSIAEALRALRLAYADFPLALRLAALTVAMKDERGIERLHRPR